MTHPMKKSMAAVIALSVSLAGGAGAYAANVTAVPISASLTAPVSVILDGQALEAAGYLKAGSEQPMLPLRAIAEELGFELTWNPENLSVELKRGAVWTSVQTGEDRYSVNKMLVTLGIAPELTDSKMYVPASFFGEVLHTTVNVEGGTVSITEKEVRESATARGVITGLVDHEGRKSLHINGMGTTGIILHISDETEFVLADGTETSFDKLSAGSLIEVEHAMMMTMSLPPQTSAFKVTVLEQAPVQDMIGTVGVIEEATTSEDGTISLRIKGFGVSETSPEEVVLRVNEDTLLTDGQGEEIEKSELVKGAQVVGFNTGVMTRSLPPIGQAWKVVLLAAPEAPEAAE